MSLIKKEVKTYKKEGSSFPFISIKKEEVQYFKKEKHTFVSFFFQKKRWKKGGSIRTRKNMINKCNQPRPIQAKNLLRPFLKTCSTVQG